MKEPESAAGDALSSLVEALGRLAAHGPSPLQLSAKCGGYELEIRGTRAMAESGVTALLLRAFFSEEEAELVRALGDQELPGSAIAKRAGVDHSTRVKLLLSNLTSRGVLAPGRNGYKVADPLIPKMLQHPKENQW